MLVLATPPIDQLCHYKCADLHSVTKELVKEQVMWLCRFCVDASERAAVAAGAPVYENYVTAADSRGSKCVAEPADDLAHTRLPPPLSPCFPALRTTTHQPDAPMHNLSSSVGVVLCGVMFPSAGLALRAPRCPLARPHGSSSVLYARTYVWKGLWSAACVCCLGLTANPPPSLCMSCMLHSCVCCVRPPPPLTCCLL